MTKKKKLHAGFTSTQDLLYDNYWMQRKKSIHAFNLTFSWGFMAHSLVTGSAVFCFVQIALAVRDCAGN